MKDERVHQIAEEVARRLRAYDALMQMDDEPFEDIEALTAEVGVVAMCVGDDDVFIQIQPA